MHAFRRKTRNGHTSSITSNLNVGFSRSASTNPLAFERRHFVQVSTKHFVRPSPHGAFTATFSSFLSQQKKERCADFRRLWQSSLKENPTNETTPPGSTPPGGLHFFTTTRRRRSAYSLASPTKILSADTAHSLQVETEGGAARRESVLPRKTHGLRQRLQQTFGQGLLRGIRLDACPQLRNATAKLSCADRSRVQKGGL